MKLTLSVIKAHGVGSARPGVLGDPADRWPVESERCAADPVPQERWLDAHGQSCCPRRARYGGGIRRAGDRPRRPQLDDSASATTRGKELGLTRSAAHSRGGPVGRAFNLRVTAQRGSPIEPTFA